jgi:hypothetical protein
MEQSFTTFNVHDRRGTEAVQPGGRPTYCCPPLEREHPPPPTKSLKVYYRCHRCVQLAEPGAGAGADVVPEALAGALAVSAGAPQPASLTCLQAWADVIAVPLVSKEVPLNGSITPMQQNFLDQVTQKIGTIQPTPRLNKRRAKGPPSGSHPWRSRRIAGLPAGQGQPDLSRSKKEVMRADFSTESGKVLEVVSAVAPPPLRFSRLQHSSIGWRQRSFELPLQWSSYPVYPWIPPVFSFGMYEG